MQGGDEPTSEAYSEYAAARSEEPTPQMGRLERPHEGYGERERGVDGAERLADQLPVEPGEGDVGAVGDDSVHGMETIPFMRRIR
jgi:hypothetical protein